MLTLKCHGRINTRRQANQTIPYPFEGLTIYSYSFKKGNSFETVRIRIVLGARTIFFPKTTSSTETLLFGPYLPHYSVFDFKASQKKFKNIEGIKSDTLSSFHGFEHLLILTLSFYDNPGGIGNFNFCFGGG